jgi:outer membrane protein OmpA-like peptidoglycan-associated protein
MMGLIKNIVLLAMGFSSIAANALEPSLDELVMKLKSSESVNIHLTDSDGVLISWATSDPRRVDNKTLSILKAIGSYSRRHQNIVVELAVFSDAQATRLSNQSMTNTEYKARRIEDVLKEESAPAADISAVGMGSEIPYNLIFASIHAKQGVTEPSIVAVPVRVR